MLRRFLAGRTAVVTRPRKQALGLAARLKARGARVIIAPLIKIAPPSSWRGLDKALGRLDSFDAVVFTSANGVDCFFKRAGRLKRKLKKPGKIFAVGPRTAAALRRRGWNAAKIQDNRGAAALAPLMGPVKNMRVLFPRAEKGREELPRILRRRGARLSLVKAYRTLPNSGALKTLRQSVKTGRIDVVIFASGSAAKNFVSQLGPSTSRRLFSRAAAASIGPATSRALRRLGIRPRVEARQATASHMTAALAAYFSRTGKEKP